jgi:hypothetical protein
LTVTGAQLASASSLEPGKRRWAEISIFRSDSGTYVVAGIGRSLVPNEHDRHWATVSETAQGAVEALRMSNDEGQWFFPAVNRRALTEASRHDPQLRQAFQTEHIS